VILHARRVGFWLRALATLIDAVFLLILWVLAILSVEFIGFRLRLNRQSIGAFESYAPIGLILLYTAMDIVFHGTPGKFCAGLEIANLDGSVPSGWTLFNRWTYKWTFLILTLFWMIFGQVLLKFLAGIWSFLIVLGCFAAAGDSRMTWHDQWAKTAIFRRRELHPKKPPAGFPVAPPQPMSRENIGG
jgi:uncharacterized RDD family membrane protein YckC